MKRGECRWKGVWKWGACAQNRLERGGLEFSRIEDGRSKVRGRGAATAKDDRQECPSDVKARHLIPRFRFPNMYVFLMNLFAEKSVIFQFGLILACCD